MKVAWSIKRLPEWLRSFVGANALRVMALGALVAVAAPLSGARAEPPPLAGSPEAWLEGAERILRANTGRLLVLVSGNGATTVYAVIHAPLAAVWIFGAPPPATEVLASGKISGRLVGTGAFITVTWNDGSLNTLVWPDALPDLALVAGSSAGMHPLAAFHDRLLANSLAGAFFGLPAGSRFGTGGLVHLPGAVAARAATEPVTLWNSLGDYIVVTHADGTTDMRGWRSVDAALKARSK